MKMRGFGGRAPAGLSLLLLVAAVAAVVLSFGAGSALANTTFTCSNNVGLDAGLQTALDTNAVVTVVGTCRGNYFVNQTVTVQGGSPGATLNGNATDSVLKFNGNYTLTVRNLTITNGSATYGGGINDNNNCGATTNLQNALVTGNTASQNGGGFYTLCGTLNDPASTISYNSAGNQGGGIYANGCGAHISVTNSTVANNTSVGAGGGILVYCSSVTLTGATVSGNTSSDSSAGGLAIYDGSRLSATASTIMQNRAMDGVGGGIDAGIADVLLTNTKVSFNAASAYGGGIEYSGGGSNNFLRPRGTAAAGVKGGFGRGPQQPAAPEHAGGLAGAVGKAPPIVIPSGMNLVNSSVDHNTATGFPNTGQCGSATVCDGGGGGIANANYNCDPFSTVSPVTLTNTSVSFNRALGNEFDTDSGGGGYGQASGCSTDTVSLVATGSSFIGNQAPTDVGGGILNLSYDGTSLVTLAGTSVASGPTYLNANKALFGGGIFNWDTGSNVTLQPGGNILHNQAAVSGGGVFNDCGATLTVVPGALILFNMPNQIFTNLGPCLLD